VLSIDVALGAICSSAWFASTFEVTQRIYAYLALGITVWIIYTADHLLDAKRISHRASSIRHRFHQNNFNRLAICVCIAVLVDGVLVFFLRGPIFYAGLTLSFFIAVYLLFNRWLMYLKEFFVAALYCAGILLPVTSIAGEEVLSNEIMLIAAFFITTLINVILFSLYEYQNDKQDSNSSIATFFGINYTERILLLLFGIQAVFIVFVGLDSLLNGIMLAIMNAILFVLFLRPRYFTKDDLFRLTGDAIFLLPLLVFLYIRFCPAYFPLL